MNGYPIDFTIPGSVAAGTYQFVIDVDSTNLIGETDEANNVLVTVGSLNVVAPSVDLVPSITSETFPPSVVAGDATNINVMIDVANAGSVDAVGTMDIVVWASPDGVPGNPANVQVATLTGIAVNLIPAQTMPLPIDFTIPGNVAAGTYQFVIDVDSTNLIGETDEANNVLVTVGSLNVVAPSVDLVPSITSETFPPSVVAGDATNINVMIDVANAGSVDAVGTMDIMVWASPDGVPGNPANVQVATLSGIAVNLIPAQTMPLPIDFTIPGNVAAGTYQFVIDVDSTNLIGETDEANNVLVTVGSLNVAAPSVDLVPSIASETLPASVVAGDATNVNVTIDVANGGTVDAVGTMDVTVWASPDGVPGNPANLQVTTMSAIAVNLIPVATMPVSLDFTIPGSVAAGTYQFVIDVDSTNLIGETDEANNVLVTVGSLNVTAPAPPTFDGTSASLSAVPYLALSTTRPSDTLSGQGTASLNTHSVTYSAETLLGVATVKVEYGAVAAMGLSSFAIWYAQDDAGGLWIFKEDQDGVPTFEALDLNEVRDVTNSPSLEHQLFAGIVPANGSTFTDPAGNTQDLIDNNATLPQFPAETFVLIKHTDTATPANVMYRYWHLATGLAVELFDSNADPANDDGFVIGALL